MEKANILKGLECCAGEEKNCNECPYNTVGACTTTLAKDAVALVKANEIPKPKYTHIIIYTKMSNLMPYLDGKASHMTDEQVICSERHYGNMREVQLIAMFRWENGKCFCKIKCPINPLPVKGEFETPSMGVIDRFLKNNGWRFKQKIYPRMFE